MAECFTRDLKGIMMQEKGSLTLFHFIIYTFLVGLDIFRQALTMLRNDESFRLTVRGIKACLCVDEYWN